MKITSVRVNVELDKTRAKKESCELVAFASVVLDGIFVVSNIRVVKADTGKIIVSMPSRQIPSGAYRDVAYPINNDFRKQLDAEVIKAVNEQISIRDRDKANASN